MEYAILDSTLYSLSFLGLLKLLGIYFTRRSPYAQGSILVIYISIFIASLEIGFFSDLGRSKTPVESPSEELIQRTTRG